MRKAIIYQFVLVGIAMIVLIVVLLKPPTYRQIETEIEIVDENGDPISPIQADDPGMAEGTRIADPPRNIPDAGATETAYETAEESLYK